VDESAAVELIFPDVNAASIIDVPEVRQLPELTGGAEDPVAFADMVLTVLLRYERALLYAECDESPTMHESISWRVAPRDSTVVSHDIEIAVSPKLGSFRSVLARFGHHYMGDQLYHGYASRVLRQRSILRRCHIYLSNAAASGFWIRVYVAGNI